LLELVQSLCLKGFQHTFMFIVAVQVWSINHAVENNNCQNMNILIDSCLIIVHSNDLPAFSIYNDSKLLIFLYIWYSFEKNLRKTNRYSSLSSEITHQPDDSKLRK